jgi:hypothetical protein
MAISKKQQALMDQCDRCVQLTREFMNDWLLFNQILSAYPSPGVNKAQLENQFLKVKSKLAREHQVIKDTLGADYKFDASIINIISSATNLESIYSQSEVAVKKLQNEWHRAFISINETLGTLEDKKTRADAGEKVAIGNEPMGGKKGGGGGPIDPGVKTLLILVAVLVVIGLVIAFAPFAQTYRDMITDIF